MSRSYIIVTNNRMIQEEFEEEPRFRMHFVEGLPELLEECMKLINEGCELAVDPLAGYMSRPNPYHTIVLKTADSAADTAEERSEAYLRDMSRLDILLSRYWLNREAYTAHGSRAEYLRDHAHIDASIGRNSIISIRDSDF